jgi:hypothetical protein
VTTRCQVCGRKKHVRKDGAIVFHFTKGDRCLGGGHPAIERDDARLREVVAQATAAADRAAAHVRELQARRANDVDSAIRRRNALWMIAFPLERRLARHEDWPARYARSMARQMEKHGYAWADPPPPYLLPPSQ